MDFYDTGNAIELFFEVDQYEGIYELLSNLAEDYDKPIQSYLAEPFYDLSIPNIVTQMGCDYARGHRKPLQTIEIVCYYNYP
ncbi:hypothetical protein AHF37_09822 [Paragonimus kellicotti]|nr:hypothetical protein AHF37_09822 [Paragonimus kellicotti]